MLQAYEYKEACLNTNRKKRVSISLATRYTLLSLTVGAVLISFSGVWVKVAHVAPNVSAFYRVFIGGFALVVAALYRRELRWPGIRHFLLSLLCGLLLALDLWLYHYSIQYIGPGLGTILPNFQVFILAAAGILVFREPVRLIYLISLPLAFVGLFMIVGLNWSQLEPTYRIGVIYGLAAAVCYAGFLLLLRQLQADQMGTSFFYVLMMVSLTTAAF
ncbi:MAG: DMT family transporter, partial [Desulfobacterales bacterium]